MACLHQAADIARIFQESMLKTAACAEEWNLVDARVADCA